MTNVCTTPIDAIETLQNRPEAGPTWSGYARALLLDIRGLSELLNRSVASLHRDDAAGRIPAGLKIGGSKRWRYNEIIDWINAGCPSRMEWESRKSA